MVPEKVRFVFLMAVLMGATLGTIGGAAQPATAQILPDATLGGERSRVTPNVLLPGGLGDRIEGGALRGGNLFHSFSDFNVNLGQRVYFANPAAIHNIIGRVTGANLSNIEGTLGVLGAANLFLINPNGIVFGPSARLDIRGSFHASTADRILFPNGYAFSATNPDLPPLLTIEAPLGLSHWLPAAGTVSSSGSLAAGQDLSLVGQTLNLQGQLQAGRDLTLLASDRLTARDHAATPLIISAGNRLLLQGNQMVDIAALNHPQSRLSSGGDMVLRSNGSVVGDTHFTIGGNFRVEQLDGSLGNLVSIQDPVFEVAGDFTLANYTGASLQILAGGSVTIPGLITITAAGGPFNDGTVTLSDGSTLTVSGTTQPTLDIRAGTTQFFSTPLAGTPTSANITLGGILNPGGLVYLTNQFQPNPALSGDISVQFIRTADFLLTGVDGGSVVIDSRGKLTFNAIDTSGGDFESFNATLSDINSNAGNVTLLARGDILMPAQALLFAYGLVGGSITLKSQSAILQQQGLGNVGIQSATTGLGTGGDITLSAPTISLEGAVQPLLLFGQGQSGRLLITTHSLRIANGAQVFTATVGAGDAGKVVVNAGSILIDGASAGDATLFGSATLSPLGGNAGDVEINTRSFTAINGGQVISFGQDLFGFGVIGNGGNIQVNASTVLIQGTNPNGVVSGFTSTILPGVVGDAGTISIQADSLTIRDGAQIRNTTEGQGNAGAIEITVRDALVIDGAVLPSGFLAPIPSAILSEVAPGAGGQGNDITIRTGTLSVTNGGFISASTVSSGDAGNIRITATRSAVFEGAPGGPFAPSGAFVGTLTGGSGNGGTLTIATPTLSVINGAQLEALTENSANAGNIVLQVGQTLLLQGTDSGILANTAGNSTGNGGSIFIDPARVFIQDGARIAVDSQGTGTAGNIFLQAGSLVLNNQGLISAETASNTGGNITLQVDDVLALRRNSRISTSAGTAGAGGNGGNIAINTQFLVALPTENSDITANAFSGRGGSVDITAQGIFGFRVLSRSDLEAALGTTDPTRLNPIFLPTSDITAISQVNPNLNGEVILRSPDTDPSRGALPQPPAIVDASRLIARDCSTGGALARKLGSLVVTGQGGLPPSPSDPLRGDTVLMGWEPLDRPTPGASPSNGQAIQTGSPVQLVEVQMLEQQADGRVILAAQMPAATQQAFWHRPVTCPDLPANR